MNEVLYLEMDKKERTISFYTLFDSGLPYDRALEVIKTVREAANELKGSYMDADSILHLNVTPRRAYKWLIKHVDRSMITFSLETATDIYNKKVNHFYDPPKPTRPYNKKG